MMQSPDSSPFRTHAETATPQIDVRHLADYMAASRQAQRRIVRDCKYRRIARVIQHTEARTVVYNYIRNGDSDPQKLLDRAAAIRGKLADDDFAVYRFNEMKAACADIAERWPAIKPPKNAIL
jgi:hypothetical protein